MRARVRFLTQPFFTSLPNKLVCPGMLIGRAELRAMWTMIFTADKQINTMIFEGDLVWSEAPFEQDFGKGVRFKLMSRPGNKRRLDGVERDPRPEPHDYAPHDGHPHPAKEKNRAARLREENKGEIKNDKPGKGEPPDHGHHHPSDPDEEVNPDLPLLRNRNFGTRPPMPGIFAEGELLG